MHSNRNMVTLFKGQTNRENDVEQVQISKVIALESFEMSIPIGWSVRGSDCHIPLNDEFPLRLIFHLSQIAFTTQKEI